MLYASIWNAYSWSWRATKIVLQLPCRSQVLLHVTILNTCGGIRVASRSPQIDSSSNVESPNGGMGASSAAVSCCAIASLFWRLFLIFLIFLISWYSWTSWYSRTSWSLDNLEFLDLKLLILLILLISWYCWTLYILGLLDLEFWARVSYLCAKKKWSFVQVYFGLAGARSGRRNWRGSCLSKSIRSISEQHDSTRFRSFTVPVLVDAAARYLCVRTEPWSVQPAALGFTQPQG